MSEHHLAVVKDNYIIALYPNPQASLFQICSSGKRKKKKSMSMKQSDLGHEPPPILPCLSVIQTLHLRTPVKAKS